MDAYCITHISEASCPARQRKVSLILCHEISDPILTAKLILILFSKCNPLPSTPQTLNIQSVTNRAADADNIGYKTNTVDCQNPKFSSMHVIADYFNLKNLNTVRECTYKPHRPCLKK